MSRAYKWGMCEHNTYEQTCPTYMHVIDIWEQSRELITSLGIEASID